ncbi:MAG: VapC toxin family PIN domain ribonuclease, partial [Acidimicrobiia bacterium]
MIVVDSSVVVAATTDVGPDGEWSRRLIASDELAAPHLFGVEVLSTIRRLELSGLLDESLASLAAADAIGVPVSGVPFDADRVWDLRHTVTVQDACYVS